MQLLLLSSSSSSLNLLECMSHNDCLDTRLHSQGQWSFGNQDRSRWTKGKRLHDEEDILFETNYKKEEKKRRRRSGRRCLHPSSFMHVHSSSSPPYAQESFYTEYLKLSFLIYHVAEFCCWTGGQVRERRACILLHFVLGWDFKRFQFADIDEWRREEKKKKKDVHALAANT